MVYADKGALRAGGAVLYAGGFLRGQRGIVCGRGGGVLCSTPNMWEICMRASSRLRQPVVSSWNFAPLFHKGLPELAKSAQAMTG